MTSVIAWLAVDSRQPTGMYFASDSRQTRPNGDFSDDCIKLYAIENEVEIFAFAGDVIFAQASLERISRAIEGGAIPPNMQPSPHGRAEWVGNFLNSELKARVIKPSCDTTILHGTRHSWGATASFYLNSFTVEAGGDQIYQKELSADLKRSSVIELTGSGQIHVRHAIAATVDVAGEFSRAFFAGFCDSVMSGDDNYSGGPIQLVGVGCKSKSRHIGVVMPQGAFYRGQLFKHTDPQILWRNCKLENVTADGMLLKGAQRHAWQST